MESDSDSQRGFYTFRRAAWVYKISLETVGDEATKVSEAVTIENEPPTHTTSEAIRMFNLSFAYIIWLHSKCAQTLQRAFGLLEPPILSRGYPAVSD